MKYSDINPITCLDYPDPDVIRVENTYYMVTTTMHFMPGCEILRSFDLVNWEHAAYVYDVLDSTKKQRLVGDECAYGQGMWAASLRFYRNKFYVCFVANDTRKTYLYTADKIEGPWSKSLIEGFYHDCSLLFDDEKVYIVYGNKEIHLTELKQDLSGPLKGGLDRIIVEDKDHPGLGYEGSHIYKIHERYYVFFIHSLRERWKRVEACFWSDSLEDEFVGGDILNDDRGYMDQGVAQGGIVDTPWGEWYAMLFQDHGAVGRIPILVPVSFQDKTPVFGEKGVIPKEFNICSTNPEYQYEPLTISDNFRKVEDKHFGFKAPWQFNHEPELSLIQRNIKNGEVAVETDKLCTKLTQAKNILTQRMRYPGCSGEVTVNGRALKEGDYVGICALQGCYGMIALTKKNNQFYVVMVNDEIEREAILISSQEVRLKVEVDFSNMRDEACFYYLQGEQWIKIGTTHKLYFKLDHFTGCRFGLFMYSTIQVGGVGYFYDFTYRDKS